MTTNNANLIHSIAPLSAPHFLGEHGEQSYFPFLDCPLCNSAESIRSGSTSCPDGRDGCCVAHYGFGCIKCLTVFQIEWNRDVMPKKPWMLFEEEPGEAIINVRALEKLRIK